MVTEIRFTPKMVTELRIIYENKMCRKYELYAQKIRILVCRVFGASSTISRRKVSNLLVYYTHSDFRNDFNIPFMYT